jgi:hypothetical protein
VIAITAITDARAISNGGRTGAMASIRAYESWWDASLIDERNEQPLHAAFVAAVAVWAAAFLLTLA